MSTTAQEITSLVESLQTKVKALDTAADCDEARKTALVTARKVVTALQKPEEVIMYYAKIPAERMSLKLGVDLSIFRLLAAAQGPLTSIELAKRTGAEELLIMRLMRVLCSISFAQEAAPRSYLPTSYTMAMTQPSMEGGVIITYDYGATGQLPDFFKTKGYRCPRNSGDAPFKWIHQTSLNYFQKIHESPTSMQAFNAYMGAIRSGRKFWADWYDVKGRVLHGFAFQPGKALLVDIGGGNGHDLETLIQKQPRTAGYLVLQDLKTTIAGLEGKDLSNKGIRAMEYDFFTEQPIKGAKVYYMHFCLHNWPDEECRTILRRVMSAMKPGYSKILLNEAVLPDRDCPPWFATNDINMMAILSGIQRDRRQWVDLIESVGLELVNVWTSPYEEDAEGIIEAILKN